MSLLNDYFKFIENREKYLYAVISICNIVHIDNKIQNLPLEVF